MYYEEDFYNQEDFDELDDVSFKPNTSKISKAMDDNRCHTIKLKNKKNIVIFSSGSIGSKIRNAVTGEYTKNLVGSSMEDLYFSISYPIGTERKKLFFDSPNQYEKHFACNLDNDVSNGAELKKKWVERVRAIQVKQIGKSGPTIIH